MFMSCYDPFNPLKSPQMYTECSHSYLFVTTIRYGNVFIWKVKKDSLNHKDNANAMYAEFCPQWYHMQIILEGT